MNEERGLKKGQAKVVEKIGDGKMEDNYGKGEGGGNSVILIKERVVYGHAWDGVYVCLAVGF